MSPYTHSRRIFVLDTNVLIHDPSSLFNFDEHDIVIPMTVLEELDHIKDSQKANHLQISRDARLAIQHIEKIVNGHAPEALKRGVSLGERLGNLRIVMEPEESELSAEDGVKLDLSVPDNRIIAAALLLHKKEDNYSVVLVTKDINMRLKAKAAGVAFVEDYRTDQVLSDINYLSAGYMKIDGLPFSDVSLCDQKGRRSYSRVPVDAVTEDVKAHLYPNFSFIQDDESVWTVVSVVDNEVTFAFRKVSEILNRSAFDIKPRNIEQALALDVLLSPDIDVVFLTGPAGTGKTLLALAAAMEMTIEDKRFDKIIVTRSATDLDQGIGFLPGTEEEKMLPWLGAFTDAMEVLAKGAGDPGDIVDPNQRHLNTAGKLHGKEAWMVTLDMLSEKANLQFKSVNFMRGRSLQNALCILDESQNLTAHQIRSMITRVGPGTKLVVLGNLAQIDAPYLSPLSSGLTVAVETFKTFERGATVMLKGGVRSPVATFAEENF